MIREILNLCAGVVVVHSYYDHDEKRWDRNNDVVVVDDIVEEAS